MRIAAGLRVEFPVTWVSPVSERIELGLDAG